MRADAAGGGREHGIGREAQDAHAAGSYTRARAAVAAGAFAEEMFALEVPSGRKGAPPVRVTADEAVAKGGDPAALAKCANCRGGVAASSCRLTVRLICAGSQLCSRRAAAA